VRGLRSDRHYVQVYKAAKEQGIAYYQDLGYTIERHGADAPQLRGKNVNSDGSERHKSGDAIEYMDNVLMSIPMEDYERLQKEGPYGDSGQEWADKLEAQIIDKRGVEDPMRGMRGGNRGYFDFRNSTRAATPEEE
jgi:hypothetical protein